MVYLVGAVLELSPERKVDAWGVVPWWAFYVAGGALIASLPVFIWRGVRWLTLTLAVLVAGKALFLMWSQGRQLAGPEPVSLYNWGFAAVAVVAAVLLARAGWPRPAPAAASLEHGAGGDQGD